jgi:putative phosphoesterase
MTLIGLISDVHATPQPVADALAIFSKSSVDHIVCAGDIAGYGNQLEETIALLIDSGCESIRGNHELMYLKSIEGEEETSVSKYFKQLPAFLDFTFDGKRLHIAHAHPPKACMGGIKLLDKQGEVQADQIVVWTDRLAAFDYDVLVVGHTHQVFAEQLGHTLVVNPGSSAFNHTCAILSLPEMTVEVFSLSNKAPIKSWNWGSYQISTE